MNNLVITIPLNTSLDPALLLDMVIEMAKSLSDEIESYDADCKIDEEEISVCLDE